MFLLLLLQCAFSLQTYKVDLDLPPQERWREISLTYKPQMQNAESYIKNQVPGWAASVLSFLLNNFHYTKEQITELQSISHYASINYNYLSLLNYYYEINAGCTSILVKLQDDSIGHCRNLDYDPDITPYLEPLVANFDYYKDGKLLFHSTGFAGYIGVLTVMRPQKYAITIDQHDPSRKFIFSDYIYMLMGKQDDVISIREAATQYEEFNEVVAYLASTSVISKCYYIISGLTSNQGVVLTMHHSGAIDQWWFSDNSWYLVETNYDHWVPPPEDDDRRDPAISKLEAIGKGNIDTDKVWDILLQAPIYRQGDCIYTTCMVSATDYFYSESHAVNSTAYQE